MKKIACAIISIGVVLAFISCNWQIPETVSVRTNADYNFSLGTFEKNLGDSMNLMGSTGEGNSSVNTYDYFPGRADKNVQHYLMEVLVKDQVIIQNDSNSLPDTMTLGDSNTSGATTSVSGEPVNLTFNPSTMLSSMKEAFGEDMADKIEFASVPLYLYCETANGIEATGTIDIYYSNNGSTVKGNTNLLTVSNDSINKPKPVFTEGQIVTTDLNTVENLSETDITNLINKKDENGDPITDLTDADQLYIKYNITSLSGSVTKEEVNAGVHLKIYAVIDIPVKFNVLADVSIDMAKMKKDGEGNASSESSSSQSSGNEEFEKYLKVIESLRLRYVAHELPIYSASGMKLGIDLMNDGHPQWGNVSIVDKNKNLTDSDWSKIEIPQKTIENMKSLSNFSPNIALKLAQGSVFSIPREKTVNMKIQMGITTNGDIQIK